MAGVGQVRRRYPAHIEYYLFHFSRRLTFHKESKIIKRRSSPATPCTCDVDNTLYYTYRYCIVWPILTAIIFVYLLTVEFRSKVACENEVVNLQCNPNSRLAMFSASYGRTEYESIQCPQPQGVPEESKYHEIIIVRLFPDNS